MEPISTLASSLAAKGGEAGIDTAKEGIRGFFQKVVGPYAGAWGENLALGPKERMHSNLIEIVATANKKARDAGIDPKQVPLKIIHPLLEAASLEDTPDLQDIWASMMVNAADPSDSSPVTASFPVILKELSSRHVKFLAALFADIRIKGAKHGKTPYEFNPSYKLSELQDVYCGAGLSQVDCLHAVSFELPSNNKVRLLESRLTDDAKSNPDKLAADLRNFDYMMAVLKRHNVIGESAWPRVVDSYDAIKNPQPKLADIEIEMETEYFLTEIGVSFVAACETPKAVTKPSASPDKE